MASCGLDFGTLQLALKKKKKTATKPQIHGGQEEATAVLSLEASAVLSLDLGTLQPASCKGPKPQARQAEAEVCDVTQ